VRIAAWRAAYDGLMPATFLAAMAGDREPAVRGLADLLAGGLTYSLLVGMDPEARGGGHVRLRAGPRRRRH